MGRRKIAERRMDHPVFKAVGRVMAESGISSYAVGGYVRDLLLQRPSKDIDIVVIGNGIDFARSVASVIDKEIRVNVYKNFGTAMFNYNGTIEFVGARKESYRANSRKPVVEGGTLEDDLSRRDFTINALALSLENKSYGKIIDLFEGVQDLEEGVIRTPLDPIATYSDDPLRMMRAIRFAAQLGFAIEAGSLAAIGENRERIKIVSQERIADEMNKIMLSPVPSTGFKLLFDTGLLHIIFPRLAALQGVDVVNGKRHKDNFYHTMQVLDRLALKSDNLWLRWAALLHDIGKPETKRYCPSAGWTFHGHEDRGSRMVPEIFRQLKLPVDGKTKYVRKLVRLHLRPISLTSENITDSALRRLLFEAGEDIDELMMLCEADITSKNKDKVKRYLHNFKLVRERLKEVEEKDRLRNWQPPVSGEMIMQIFDLQPCKQVGIIKTAIREAILEGEIRNDGEEAFHYMIKKGRELGLTPVKTEF